MSQGVKVSWHGNFKCLTTLTAPSSTPGMLAHRSTCLVLRTLVKEIESPFLDRRDKWLHQRHPETVGYSYLLGCDALSY